MMLKRQIQRVGEKIAKQASLFAGEERRKNRFKRQFLEDILSEHDDRETVMTVATRVLSRLRELHANCGQEAVMEVIGIRANDATNDK